MALLRCVGLLLLASLAEAALQIIPGGTWTAVRLMNQLVTMALSD
jgi:hypothetical protein